MSFLMAFCLYEKGFREMDFNFSWGYMYGIFFAFVGALLVLLRATGKADTKKKKGLAAIQWLAYLWHLVCGLYYFWGFLQGFLYEICSKYFINENNNFFRLEKTYFCILFVNFEV